MINVFAYRLIAGSLPPGSQLTFKSLFEFLLSKRKTHCRNSGC